MLQLTAKRANIGLRAIKARISTFSPGATTVNLVWSDKVTTVAFKLKDSRPKFD